MHSFEIEVIFAKHLFKLELYFSHIHRCFEHIGSIYQIETLLISQVRALDADIKKIGSNERLIKFWLSLDHMLLYPRTAPIRKFKYFELAVNH